MNADQFINILKRLQKNMVCPSCETIYKIDEVQFLGQVDGLFLLQLSCQKCNLPVWMNFMMNDSDSQKPKKLAVSDLSSNDNFLEDDPEISSDEILNFHGFIDEFDGNFKKEIKRLLERMKDMDEEGLMGDIWKNFSFDLCKKCRNIYLKSPLGLVISEEL